MKNKPIGEQLDVYECIQLLDKAAEYGVAVRRDPHESNNLIVYTKNPFDEGYHSVPITDCAKMLARDMTGQTYIRERLKLKGIELTEFAEITELNSAAI